MKATQVRKGNIIKLGDKLFKVLVMDHVTPGKGRAHVQTKLRNLLDGNQTDKRFRSDEDVEKAFLEGKSMHITVASTHKPKSQEASPREEGQGPVPPQARSSPGPPLSRSRPAAPRSSSLPRLPKRRSAPARPQSLSAPLLPMIRSAPALPKRRSLPASPTTVIADADVAKTRARPTAASRWRGRAGRVVVGMRRN